MSTTVSYDPDTGVFALPAAPPPPAETAPIVGNGTVALVPDLAPMNSLYNDGGALDTARSVLGCADSSSEGGALDGFHACQVRLAFAGPNPTTGAERPVRHVLQDATLDTTRGVFTARYRVEEGIPTTPAGSGVLLCEVEHELRALRHLPHFVMHTLALTVPAAQQAGLRVFHIVRPDAALARPVFNGATVDPVASREAPAYALTASAEHPQRGTAVHLVSAYLPEEAELCEVVGCNVLGSRVSGVAASGYTRLALRAAGDGQPQHTYRLHILTGMREGPGAATLLLQAALAVIARGAAGGLEAAQIQVAAHDAAWAAAWETDVTVTPKDGLDPAGADALGVLRVRRALRAAMYHIHATTSPSAGRGVLDPWEVQRRPGAWDTAVLPVLALLMPDALPGALGPRVDALTTARQAARQAGLRGALILGGEGGENATPLWQASTALRIATTAFAAIHVWDYYRVSQDLDWLQGSGYPLLRDAADAIVSAAQPRAGGAPGVTLAATVGLDESAAPAADNALTVAACIVALRCACEASYQLGLPAKAAWRNTRVGLRVPFAPSPPAPGADIVLRDADSSSLVTSDLLEPLLLLSPLLSGGAFGSTALTGFSARDAGTLQRNMLYWAAHAGGATGGTTGATNALLLTQVAAQYAQVVSSSAASAAALEFDAALTVALDTCFDDAGWGGLCAKGPAAGPPDLGLSAALLLVMLYGLAGVAVTGGVSENRYKYAPLGVTIANSAVLPAAWLRLMVTGLAPLRADYPVVNQLLLTGGGGSSGGGGALDPASLVPWSTNTLSFVF